ncbi:hypothetical protein [Pseudooceanicola sp. HF7]|uniref:hypothetical protein n=1 Tax=Pseudooceanicola sp. HF7 TaxID=2721560 RepID=UPI00142FD940|nr:hypothetical protein [Pseudooceanicola sp. HF7]NIZ08361.1 hypothetical protein [Pseudooceanicola sp. HF7]
MVLLAPIIIALFFYIAWKMYSPGTRDCRWRMNRALNRDGKTYLHCTHCGAEYLSEDGAPPKICVGKADAA